MYHSLRFILLIHILIVIINIYNGVRFKVGAIVVQNASALMVKTNYYIYSSYFLVREIYLNLKDIAL